MSSLGIIFPDQLSENNLVYEHLKAEDDLLLYEPIETFSSIIIINKSLYFYWHR